jgi:2-haloacid dehalogenase
MPAPEALAFDMYGTLVDPVGIGKQLERYLPEHAPRIAKVWRRKQLEYTFRLTAMDKYEDFEWVTRKALDYALAAAELELDADQKDELMTGYTDLERFPDVEPGLKRLKEAGHTMVVFSNGAPHMLDALMDAAELHAYFRGFVSVHDVKVYKPSPKTYQHVAERLGRPIGKIRLVSSNPFDDIGAEAVGMRAAWVNRSGSLFDTLGSPPEIVVGSLIELADALESRQE